jgi:hypothetical protein
MNTGKEMESSSLEAMAELAGATGKRLVGGQSEMNT